MGKKRANKKVVESDQKMTANPGGQNTKLKKNLDFNKAQTWTKLALGQRVDLNKAWS